MEDRLTTAQAAARLGVKPETIYAYVSRGLLVSTRVAGVRGSMFDAEEVEALAGRETARRTGVGTVERIRTSITLVDNGNLYYRGCDAVELSSSRFESVAHLLWTGVTSEDAEFVTDPSVAQQCRLGISSMPATARIIDRIRTAVAIAACYSPMRFDTGRQSVVSEAGRLMATIAAALCDNPEESTAESLWKTFRTNGSHSGGLHVLKAALVLMADHGLAASTLAVRVAASTRANIYSALSAGLGCIDGPLHGCAAEPVHHFLASATEDPIVALAQHIRSGAAVPGFGHLVYTERDPRAEELLRLLRDPSHGADARVVESADVVIDQMAQRFDTFPNSDFALATYARAYGLAADVPEAVFALARLVGWTAHALEEYDEDPLRFRVPGIYTGTRPIG